MTVTAPALTDLTDLDRRIIALARELVATRDMDALRERTGETESVLALANALGEAKFLLGELAALAERLGGKAC